MDPACSLAFEAEHEKSDVMTRPPRYLFAVQRRLPDEDIRAFTFFTLVLSNLGLIVANRSFRLPTIPG